MEISEDKAKDMLECFDDPLSAKGTFMKVYTALPRDEGKKLLAQKTFSNGNICMNNFGQAAALGSSATGSASCTVHKPGFEEDLADIFSAALKKL